LAFFAAALVPFFTTRVVPVVAFFTDFFAAFFLVAFLAVVFAFLAGPFAAR